MSLVSFPTSYAIAEPNPESGQLELTQGWIQAFTLFNSHLEGDYNRNRATSIKTAVTHNNFNPLTSLVYINYKELTASDVLTFPFKLWGFIDVRDSSGSIVQSIMCQGVKTITITNINAGDIVTGALTTGVE